MVIVLCDDDKRILNAYSMKIQALAKQQAIKIELHCFEKGTTLLKEVTSGKLNPDVIFLDIHMPEMFGDEVAKRLRECGYENDIIFFTVSTQIQHFKEAFNCRALDYVIKNENSPEPDSDFEQIFQKAVDEYKEREQQYVLLSFAGVTRNIAIDDIHYFEYRDRKLTVYYGDNKEFQFFDTLEKFQNLLEFYGFIRVHTAFLVKKTYIESIRRGEMTLKDGTIISFNKNRTSAFRQELEHLANISS